MSDKRKFDRAEALAVALEIMDVLNLCCERIAFAGSIRRQKPLVGDIELLMVESMGMRPADLFSVEEYSLSEQRLDELLAMGVIAKRQNINGGFTWGKQNRLAIHCQSQIPIDFFSVPLRCWHVGLVIRTGGKATNLQLTTTALKLGMRLHAYGGIERLATGETTYPESEEEVFRLCGVKYLPPNERQ